MRMRIFEMADARLQLTFSSDIPVERAVVHFLQEQESKLRSIEAKGLALEGFRLVQEMMDEAGSDNFEACLIHLGHLLGMDREVLRQYLGLPALVLKQRIDIKRFISKDDAPRNLRGSAAETVPDFTREHAETVEKTVNAIEGVDAGGVHTQSLNDDNSINDSTIKNDLMNLVGW